MDDGSPIALKVTIDEKTGDATFDFSGTGPEVRGNWNAPISVVHSAIIYWSVSVHFALREDGEELIFGDVSGSSMRAMVDQDIPLNAGCLVPLKSKCLTASTFDG